MKAKPQTQLLKNVKKGLIRGGYGFLVLYLAANIWLSQKISPLYFQFLQDERSSIVEFLRGIRTLPVFQEKLILYKNLYGRGIENEVFASDVRRQELINKLEQLLKNNPSERDILYSLYILYSDQGNTNIANVYLERAKEIDPTIK